MSVIVNIKDFDECIRDYPSIIKYIEQDYDLCLRAIRVNSDSFKYIENQSDEMRDIALKDNLFCFKYVKNQTRDMCLSVVKQMGEMVSHCQYIDEEIVYYAIKNTWTVIQDVISIRPDLITIETLREAVRQNIRACYYLKRLPHEFYLEAIKINPNSLKYLRYQTFEICELAVSLSPETMKYIQCKKMKQMFS